jgi:hypothetical protein
LPSAARPASGAPERALDIIGRAQRHGVLRVLGPQPVRVVQLGRLQNAGHTIGASALLALRAPRHDVKATLPLADVRGARQVRLSAPVLRDVLVDVDLRTGTIVGVQPGPASQTTAWSAPAAPPVAASARAAGTPGLVRLSAQGPILAPYDGSVAPAPKAPDWPVSLVFAGHATVGKVKHALRTIGFTRVGEKRWLAYGAAAGQVRFDGDRGLKTPCDANGTDVHLRLYAPTATDHFVDPQLGDVVVATVHLDRGEGCGAGPRMFGFSEVAEGRVADAVSRSLGWRVARNRIPVGNAEPFRHDLAAPDHVWWSNGRATLISVP